MDLWKENGISFQHLITFSLPACRMVVIKLVLPEAMITKKYLFFYLF